MTQNAISDRFTRKSLLGGDIWAQEESLVDSEEKHPHVRIVSVKALRCE